MARQLIVILAAALCLVSTAAGSKGEVAQLIETRGGKQSVWGVTVTLAHGKFKERISADDLAVVEAKHSSDITPLMEWAVNADGSQLTIRFKPGKGDFGSSNSVTVKIRKEVIDGDAEGRSWSIETDIRK